MKKFTKIAVIVLVLVISFSYFLITDAQNVFFLEKNEVVLDKEEVSDDRIVIFTELDGQFYKKDFILKDGHWVIEDSSIIETASTGLIMDVEDQEGDSELEYNLENKLKASGFSLNNLPNVVDYSNSPYLPPVGKQMENSCVGWSTGYYLRTYQQARDIGWQVKYGNNMIQSHVFSPSFIYNQINDGYDGGANLQDAGELLKNIGTAPLSVFPYVPADIYTQPNEYHRSAAGKHKIRDWRILFTKNDSKEYMIEKTKEYLNTEDLVIAGIKIGFKFQDVHKNSDGISIITTEEYTHSGHAITLVGYDDNIPTPEGFGAFKFINSWGDTWADNGFAYITYDAFVANVTAGFVFTDLVDGRIVDDIGYMNGKILSPTKVKFTWDKPVNVSGYRILDENFNVISNVYDNSYTEYLDEPEKVTRYVQAFNSMSMSNVVSAEVDTRNLKEEELPLFMNNSVEFKINFSGNGKYSIDIKDEADNLVNHEGNLQGTPGLNVVTWNGKDNEGNNAPNGQYKLYLTSSTSSEPFFGYEFKKENRASRSSAKAYKFDGEIQSIQIEVSSESDSELNISISCGDEVVAIVKNENILEGQSNVYIIDSEKYEFNNVNLDDIKVHVNLE